MAVVTQHPWQNGPAELVSYALEHLHRENDFDQRIAFLLLDIAVETLFKTFLTLPDEVTGARTKYHVRREAAEGNFHQLVKGVQDAAADRLKEGLNLDHVRFYHDLRNKLYHQGNGITVPTEKAKAYAELAVGLLSALLEVDLTTKLRQPEIERTLLHQVQEVQQGLSRFREDVAFVIEKMEPGLLLPSFVRELADIARQERKEPEDFGEMLVSLVLGYGIPMEYMDTTIMHYYDWQQTGQRGSYLPPDLADPTTIYLRYMESVLAENNYDLWEELEGTLDHYWEAKDYVELASSATVAAAPALIEKGRQVLAELEAVRALLPQWLSREGETQERPPAA
jgi:hypothetical protein